MDHRVKNLWLDALRSGEYEQCTGMLRRVEEDEPTYCCLGVLCDLHAKETGGAWGGSMYLNEDGMLPPVVRDWAGLESCNPRVSTAVFDNSFYALEYEVDDAIFASIFSLSSLNDGVDDNPGCEYQPSKTFEEIADIIEEYF